MAWKKVAAGAAGAAQGQAPAVDPAAQSRAQAQAQAPASCQTCGGAARWVPEYSRHYCDACQQYV